MQGFSGFIGFGSCVKQIQNVRTLLDAGVKKDEHCPSYAISRSCKAQRPATSRRLGAIQRGVCLCVEGSCVRRANIALPWLSRPLTQPSGDGRVQQLTLHERDPFIATQAQGGADFVAALQLRHIAARVQIRPALNSPKLSRDTSITNDMPQQIHHATISHALITGLRTRLGVDSHHAAECLR